MTNSNITFESLLLDFLAENYDVYVINNKKIKTILNISDNIKVIRILDNIIKEAIKRNINTNVIKTSKYQTKVILKFKEPHNKKLNHSFESIKEYVNYTRGVDNV